ncbi:MAG: ketoacyl-ACP synthase III [Clostridiales bacterium]|nr:ketoacyl-ACP synthase III [Clostridiales bacterium]
MIRSRIIGFERALPPFTVTNDDLAEIVDTSDEWISSRTGIHKRHLAVDQNTSDLCIIAADKLIKKAGWNPLSVDLIVLGTVSPDYTTPSTACLVQEALGCKNAFCFDLAAACSGFIYSLSVADKFIKAGEVKRAIVLGGETLSKITDWSDRSTCVLFGDGAGGVLLEAAEEGGILFEDIHSDGSRGMALTAGYRANKSPYYKAEPKSSEFIDMNGREVFTFATRKVPESINRVLEQSGMTMDDISYVVLHQANTRINEVIARKLKAPAEKFFSNIDKIGNTSGASVPIALAKMNEEGLLKKGDKILISGFGGGLTWATMLIEL